MYVTKITIWRKMKSALHDVASQIVCLMSSQIASLYLINSEANLVMSPVLMTYTRRKLSIDDVLSCVSNLVALTR